MEIFLGLLIIIFSLFILRCAIYQRDSTIINVFYIFWYLFQVFIALVILFFDADYTIDLVDISVNLKDTILPYLECCFFAIIGIYIGMRIQNVLYKTRIQYSLTEKCYLICQWERINTFSLLLGVFFAFSIISIFLQLYFVNVLFLTFSFLPIIVGFVWCKLKHVNKRFWLILLVINFLFHAVQGSRGYALLPIVFFAVGYYISIKVYYPERLGKLIAISLIACIITLPFFSKMQDFRDVKGRGMDVSIESISEFVSFFTNDVENYNKHAGIKGSLGRLLQNPNFTIPFMCPNSISYRGSDSILDEIKSIFVLHGADGAELYRAQRASLNYGVGALSKYGYKITEETSTGLTLLADGYSRFGYKGVFIYSIFVSILLGFLEKFSINLWERNRIVSLLFYFYVLRMGILSFGTTYYAFMKAILFKGFLVLIFAVICYNLTKTET